MYDIAIGACILASGGGGSYQASARILAEAVPDEATVTVVDVEEVDQASWLCVSALMGAPEALFEANHAFAAGNALDGLERHLREQRTPGFDGFRHVLPVEVGAVNSVSPLTAAARKGIPVIDADGAGRSIPTLSLDIFAAHGLPLFPNCIASDSRPGEPYHAAFIDIEGRSPEAGAQPAFLGVQTSAPFGGIAGLAMYAMVGAELQRSMPVRGTLALAQALGAEYRRGEGIERAHRIAARINGAGRACDLIFDGYITAMEQATGSTDVGHIVVSANADGTGAQLWIYNQNENIYACRTDRSAPYITAPDSISYVPAAADQQVFDNSDLWRRFRRDRSFRPKVYILWIAAPDLILSNATLMRSWQAQRARIGYPGVFVRRPWLGA